MFSYEFYKVVHLLAILLLVASLGGLAILPLRGGKEPTDDGTRKLLTAVHGASLLVVFIAGFGLVARLQSGWPLWVLLKIGVWLLLGASLTLVRRKPELARVWFFALPLVAGLAAAFAVFKPGA